ncbi:MAG TPA: MmcQ/YjbR family DNA-binding protein [Microbacterium sp.]|nr:MmcQ/YjbR family DNA-binding protein [Microbacterium sp.]
MVTIEDVRAIALTLPGAQEQQNGHSRAPGWRVSAGLFAWVRPPRQNDLDQLAAAGRSWPDGDVLGIRTESLDEKDALLAAEPALLFDIPHFHGYPAVLVRLSLVDRERLAELITDAWLARAPKTVARAWLDAHGLQ